MKKITIFSLLFLFLSASVAFAGKGLPKTLAGITLGADMQTYSKYCNMKLAVPDSDAPFLTEARIKADVLPGIRGGSLIYGNCGNVDKIVRIKLKFNDRSQKLFNELVEDYTDAFGKANSYKGDSFRNVIAWEWRFTQGDERVTVLLMWSRDKEIRPGVSIKMTYSSLYDKEFECFKEENARIYKEKKASKVKDLRDFIPH